MNLYTQPCRQAVIQCVVSFVFGLSSIALFGQPQNVPPAPSIESLMTSPNADYDSIHNILENYYQNYSDTAEDGGYRHYIQWESFWETRAGKAGDSHRGFDDAYEKYGNIMNYQICQSNPGNSFWAQVGPMSDVGGSSSYGNRGFVTSIAVDPNNSDIVYIGSNAGGLWKTTTFASPNPTWINLTNTTHLPGLCINDIAIDLNNSNIIYLATGNTNYYGEGYGIGLIKTTDGGVTWTALSPVPPSKDNVFRRVIIDHANSSIIYTISNSCFFKSVNGGTTWTSVCDANLGLPDDYQNNSNIYTKPRLASNLTQHPNNSNILYFSSNQSSAFAADLNGAIFSFSTDGGDHWTQATIQTGGTQSGNIALAVSDAEPNSIWAFFKDRTDNKAKLYKSANAGLSWSLKYTKSGINISEKLIVSPTDPTHFYFGGVSMYRLILPTTGNPNFSTITTGMHVDIRSLFFLEGTSPSSQTNQDKVLVGNDGGISYTDNGGTTAWQNKNGNFSSQLFHGIAVTANDPGLIFGGCQDNHNKVYEDGIWSYCGYASADGGSGVMDRFDKNYIYDEKWCCSNSSYFLRRDIKNLTGWSTSGTANPYEKAQPSMPIHQMESSDLFAGWVNLYKITSPKTGSFNNSALIPLTDFSNQFPNANSSPIIDFAVAPTNESTIYVIKPGPCWCNLPNETPPGVFFKSTTGGGTGSNDWVDMTLNLPEHVIRFEALKCIAVDPNDQDNLWIGAGNFAADDNGTFPYNGIFRVINSTDGGATWTDYSDNLPPFPVNDILYEPGTDGGLYAATDVGVFYTNNSIYPTDGWICFNNLLPVNIINDIDINPCAGTIYASAYGQGVWVSPLANTTMNEVNITGNQTISNNRAFISNLVIEPGATLTIEPGVTLRFGENAHIMVKQGGTLICDGCTLTNYCPEFWEGIQVWGNENQHQYAYSAGQFYQGRAILKNDATISNARNGIRNWNPEQFSSRGGIIQAINTNFKNCWRSAEFMWYQNFSSSNPQILRPEQSFFKLCHFTIDDDYHEDQNSYPPLAGVTIWKTDRLRFEGCSFVNSSTVSTSEARTHAIGSENANYIVKEYCNDPFPNIDCENETRSSFTGWNKAIEAKATYGRPLIVKNTDFDKNMIGIELAGVNYSEIYWNNFKIGGHPYSFYTPPQHEDENHLGVFSNQTLHFSIEQNTFERDDEALYPGHGVLVYNSKDNDNRIYNNEYTNLKTGDNAWQINRSTISIKPFPAGMIGLQFICNENTGNEVDFEVSRLGSPLDLDYQDSGIRYFQGDYLPLKAAGNTFSSPDPNPYIYTDYTIDTDNPNFYISDNANAPDPNEVTPNALTVVTTAPSNSCPLTYTHGIVIGHPGKMVQKLGEMQELAYTYTQIIDDGNTQGTINEIELTWSEDAWELREQLIARSPYNSEAVLIAAIDKNIMPHGMLLEVLLSNPDALRSGDVIKEVETALIDPMPQYMIDLLYASRDETTLRTNMESALSVLHAEVSDLQKRTMHQEYFKDEDSTAPDSSLFFLSKLHTLGSNYTLAFAKAERGNYNAAISLLDSTLAYYKLKTYQVNEANALKNLLLFLQGAHNAGHTLANLDTTEITALQQIAENPTAGLAAQKAQNALCFHYGICYDATGTPKNNAPHKPPKRVNKDELIGKINNSIVYPSPADGFITVAYNLLHAKENTVLHIYDNIARNVFSIKLGEAYQGEKLIDTRNFTNGIYILEIRQDDIQIEVNKFVVTH